jgi:hypothetical protein
MNSFLRAVLYGWLSALRHFGFNLAERGSFVAAGFLG